jgi:competence protein ComEC
MVSADFFFWGLAAVIGGVFASSFLRFAAITQAMVCMFAAVAAVVAAKKRTSAAVLAFVIVAGLALGIVRAEMFWGNDTARANALLETPQFLAVVRSRFETSLARAIPEPESSLAAGILLGKSATFAPDFVEALRRTSTMHIVAVSGYNITVVAANVLRFFELLKIPLLIAWWGAVAAVILFTLLVGAPASAVRAAIMGVVVLIGKRIGRTSPQRIALAFAAALMLLWRPDLLRFDAGFQLSFLATIGIFWMAPIIEEKVLRKKRLWGLGRIFAETLGAQIVVAPWILYRFGNLSVLGAAANVVVLPIIPLTMFLSLLVGIAGLLWQTAASLVAPVAYVPLAFAVKVIHAAGTLPFAAFRADSSPIWLIAALYAIMFAFMIRYWRMQKTNE